MTRAVSDANGSQRTITDVIAINEIREILVIVCAGQTEEVMTEDLVINEHGHGTESRRYRTESRPGKTLRRGD